MVRRPGEFILSRLRSRRRSRCPARARPRCSRSATRTRSSRPERCETSTLSGDVRLVAARVPRADLSVRRGRRPGPNAVACSSLGSSRDRWQRRDGHVALYEIGRGPRRRPPRAAGGAPPERRRGGPPAELQLAPHGLLFRAGRRLRDAARRLRRVRRHVGPLAPRGAAQAGRRLHHPRRASAASFAAGRGISDARGRRRSTASAREVRPRRARARNAQHPRRATSRRSTSSPAASRSRTT